MATTLAVWNFNDSNTTVDRTAPGITATMSSPSGTYFSGTTINADAGDAAGQAHAIVGTAAQTLTFMVGTNGFADITVSLAIQRTSTGSSNDVFQYTTNGGATWVPVETWTPPASFAAKSFNLSSIDALENNPNAGFRIQFPGASSGSGNNRFDNLKIVAATTAVTTVAPTVTSSAATAIGDNGATLNGDVSSDGGSAITGRGFIYSTSNSNLTLGGVNGTTVFQSTDAGTTGFLASTVSGLTAGTQYFFVAYATNAIGTTYSAPVLSFATTNANAVLPTVTDPTATGISQTTATLGGNVTDNGGAAITGRGVLYSLTDSTPTLGEVGSGVFQVTAAGTTGAFTVPVTGLSASTEYFYVAYATNSVGTSYTSPVTTFTTADPVAPTVSNPTVSGITPDSAVLGGTVAADGGAEITGRGVLYSLTDPTPTIGEAGVFQATASGTTGVFSVPVTGLDVGATYYVVAYATNSAGTSYTSPAVTFSTPIAFLDFDNTPLNLNTGASYSPAVAPTPGQIGSGFFQANGAEAFGVGQADSWPATGGAPFATGDDSVIAFAGSLFTGDTEGILGADFTRANGFFSVKNSTQRVATFQFDLGGSYDSLSLSADIGADGNAAAYAAGSKLLIEYSLDGGTTFLTAFLFEPTSNATVIATTGDTNAGPLELRPMDAGTNPASTSLLRFTGTNTITKTRPEGDVITGDGSSNNQLFLDRSVSRVAADASIRGRLDSYSTELTGSAVTSVIVRVTGQTGNKAIAIDNIRISGNTAAPVAPTVTTPTANAIGTTSASLGGNVESDGGQPIIERGVIYSIIDTTPTLEEVNGTTVFKVTASPAEGVFTLPITGLSHSTTYNFVAYATNSIGTTYTSFSNFTTATPSKFLQFDQPSYTVNESAGTVTLTVTRSGDMGGSAESVSISNADFETNAVADGAFTLGIAPSGWTSSSTSSTGVWDPAAGRFTVSPAGNLAYIDTTSGTGAVSIAQLLGATLTADTEYVLSVDVGTPLDIAGPYSPDGGSVIWNGGNSYSIDLGGLIPATRSGNTLSVPDLGATITILANGNLSWSTGQLWTRDSAADIRRDYSIELWAGGVMLQSVSGMPVAGAMNTVTLNYTSGSTVTPDQLEIRLVGAAVGDSSYRTVSFGDVSLAAEQPSTLSVAYSIAPGSAAEGEDYNSTVQPISGTLTFDEGETTKTIVIDIVDDAFIEGTQDLTVTLSNPGADAVIAGTNPVTVEITDNDTSSLPLWLDPLSAATWDDGTNTLTVTGNTTIIMDPATFSDTPIIVGNSTVASVLVDTGPSGGRTICLGGLNLTSGASLTVASLGGSRTQVNHYVLVIGDGIAAPTFAIDTDSSGDGLVSFMDLNDSDMILKSLPVAAVEAQVASGFNFFAWDGPGIRSSASLNDPNNLTTLGVLDGATYAAINGSIFGGLTVSDTDVLVKWTYYGDADLNGLADGTDYALIDTGFANGLTGWFNGDFDHSGVVDGTDYALVDTIFVNQGSPL